MDIKREYYIRKLEARRGNGMIKVVTGMRRSGKTYLLLRLFPMYLKSQGVDEDHIIRVELDSVMNRGLRDPRELYSYVHQRIVDDEMYYILLDEVQLVEHFEDLLNGLLHLPNADVYVTGSNARLLSKDIITEFRGRGDEVRVYPLSFSEFCTVFEGSPMRALDTYMLYGGLPQVALFRTEEQRVAFLNSLFDETYLRDILERYKVNNNDDLEELVDILASNVATLTNPKKLVDTFRSVKGSRIAHETVVKYIDYLCDAFLLERATRYDIKGRHYINTPHKYYFSDLGLRNARLNFRQHEPTHLMENVIYNELRRRGFNVDVGVVPVVRTNAEGRQQRTQLEVDFVCNLGSRRYYVQSAYRLDSPEKRTQECASLLRIDDSFKRLIITGQDQLPHRDDHGITTIGIYDFLSNENSLDV